jgi:hypothetical protein
MRMCKPSFTTTDAPLPVDGSMQLLPGGLPSAPGVSTSVALATTPLLTLPQSFGDIYLGETLSAYVSTCNQAPYQLGAVQLKVEVQTSSQRQLLLNRAGSGPAGELPPGGRADCIVRYELREIGVHILVYLTCAHRLSSLTCALYLTCEHYYASLTYAPLSSIAHVCSLSLATMCSLTYHRSPY